MRIYEIINESDDYRKVMTKNISPQLNGGRLEIIKYSSDEYPSTAYSYSYFNDKITDSGPVFSYNVNVLDGTMIQYHYSSYPEGLSSKNVDNYQVRLEFAGNVTRYFRIQMKEGKTIMAKNNPWTDYQELKEVAAFMDDIVKSAEQTREILRKKMSEQTKNIGEDTTVNMSPYKDSIKNAETPKQKSAKNKIGELTRK